MVIENLDGIGEWLAQVTQTKANYAPPPDYTYDMESELDRLDAEYNDKTEIDYKPLFLALAIGAGVLIAVKV